MKKCFECKEIKSFDEFYIHGRSKDGYSYVCKSCQRLRDKAKYLEIKESGKVQKYKEQNEEKIRAYNIEYQRSYRGSGRKQERKLQMCDYKGGKCVLCGLISSERNIAAFDFHHLNPKEKEYGPSDMTNMRWSRITEELDKCVLLCSNCHRIIHADNTVGSLLTEEPVTTIETMYLFDTEGSRVGCKLLASEAGGA